VTWQQVSSSDARTATSSVLQRVSAFKRGTEEDFPAWAIGANVNAQFSAFLARFQLKLRDLAVSRGSDDDDDNHQSLRTPRLGWPSESVSRIDGFVRIASNEQFTINVILLTQGT
jgi:hypothetical protein